MRNNMYEYFANSNVKMFFTFFLHIFLHILYVVLIVKGEIFMNYYFVPWNIRLLLAKDSLTFFFVVGISFYC